MKLSAALMNVLALAEAGGVKRVKLIMDQEEAMGRSISTDRFIYQWPQCKDLNCGKSPAEIKEAVNEGCLIKDNGNDFITADSGSITYPQDGSDYKNFMKCIWQVRPKSANKFLKFRVTALDLEYDQYCGLDKLHVYRQGPEKFGGRLNIHETRVSRICGGQSGPKFQKANFLDAVGSLTRYSDNTCPLLKKTRKGKRKKCQIEGNKKFFEIEDDIMTIVFESDQSKRFHKGFTLEWSTYPRPKPTPPPPADFTGAWMENWLVNQKLLNSQWGIFRWAREFVKCPQFIIQARQCHNRYKLNKAAEAKSRFRNVLDIMRHPQNYRPQNCYKKGNEKMPEKFIALRDELKSIKNRSPASFEKALSLYLETQKWKLSDCTSNNKFADLNQIKHHFNYMMQIVENRRNVF